MLETTEVRVRTSEVRASQRATSGCADNAAASCRMKASLSSSAGIGPRTGVGVASGLGASATTGATGAGCARKNTK